MEPSRLANLSGGHGWKRSKSAARGRMPSCLWCYVLCGVCAGPPVVVLIPIKYLPCPALDPPGHAFLSWKLAGHLAARRAQWAGSVKLAPESVGPAASPGRAGKGVSSIGDPSHRGRGMDGGGRGERATQGTPATRLGFTLRYSVRHKVSEGLWRLEWTGTRRATDGKLQRCGRFTFRSQERNTQEKFSPKGSAECVDIATDQGMFFVRIAYPGIWPSLQCGRKCPRGISNGFGFGFMRKMHCLSPTTLSQSFPNSPYARVVYSAR